MLAHTLDEALMESVLAKARVSPRLRANHCFHAPTERLQRMVNCALKGSYFAPHRHDQPGKLEIFTVLRGRVVVAAFDEDGDIADKVLLDPARGPWQIEIPPGTWHTLAVLSAEAVLYEIIDGHYDAATHKRFAPWAPPEADASRGQAWLESFIHRCGFDTGF
jgi:cupin fold WbuC family metalloprotein